MPFSRGLSRSMATIASSTSLPMDGCLALPWRCAHRASFGTQKTFSARYSSASSGSAPSSLAARSRWCISSNESEMYFRKIRPEDDVLVLRRIHIVAEFVGGEPQLGLKTQIGTVAVGLAAACSLPLSHFARFRFCEWCCSSPASPPPLSEKPFGTMWPGKPPFYRFGGFAQAVPVGVLREGYCRRWWGYLFSYGPLQ